MTPSQKHAIRFIVEKIGYKTKFGHQLLVRNWWVTLSDEVTLHENGVGVTDDATCDRFISEMKKREEFRYVSLTPSAGDTTE